MDPDEALKYPGSVGREFEGNSIVVLDQYNTSVPADTVGRIAVHSYMNMEKYLNYSSEFVKLDDKNYLLTSDYGYKNLDGYLFVVQRKNNMNNNIYNFHAIENDMHILGYVSDVFVFESKKEKLVDVNIVLKKYHPYSKICSDAKLILEKHEINEVKVNIVPSLDYTLTGKIKLLSTVAN